MRVGLASRVTMQRVTTSRVITPSGTVPAMNVPAVTIPAVNVPRMIMPAIAVLILVILTATMLAGPSRAALQPTRFYEQDTDFDVLFELNKVLKYGFGGQWSFSGHRAFNPRFQFSALYGTGTKQWYPSVFVEQPLLRDGTLHGWVRASRLAEPFAFDDRILTRDENTLAALLIREDFFDYTEIRRVAGGLRLGPVAEQTLTVGMSKERHKSMDRVAQKTGLFGGDKVFPRNAVSTEMEPTLITLRYDWQTPGGWTPWKEERWRRRRNGAWVTWEGWWADPDIAGHLTMTRQLVEGRVLLSPHRTVELRFRTAVGWTPYGNLYGQGFALYPGLEGTRIIPPDEPSYLSGPGRLPPQWTFHAGGIGTLRGHDEKEFVGDHVILANAEYVLRTSRDVGIVLFTDLGRAWYEEVEDIDDLDDMAWDGGVGVELGDRDFRIQLGQDLRDFERKPRVTVRVERAF